MKTHFWHTPFNAMGSGFFAFVRGLVFTYLAFWIGTLAGTLCCTRSIELSPWLPVIVFAISFPMLSVIVVLPTLFYGLHRMSDAEDLREMAPVFAGIAFVASLNVVYLYFMVPRLSLG